MNTTTLEQQRSFFEAFGFLKLPGLLADEVGMLEQEFRQVFVDLGLKHNETARTSVLPFADKRPALSALLDRAELRRAITNLVGPDFNYMGSDGNYYFGDTTWHRDGDMPSNSFIKVAFYLDSVRAATGCLRVIPGSHTDAAVAALPEEVLRDAPTVWGMSQAELPSVALESDPGDVLIFSHRLLHASFGGSASRRMFTLNMGRRAVTEQEIADLITYGDMHFVSNGCTQPYGDAMINGAPAERRIHLTQLPQYWQAAVDRHAARQAV